MKQIDLTGQKYGKLTVIKLHEQLERKDGGVINMWECQCDCDEHNICYVSTNNLRQGNVKSCGCLRKNLTGKIKPKIDLTGKTFGLLTVLGQGNDIIRKNKNVPTWLCQCSCENKTIVEKTSRYLKDKKRLVPANCGCLQHHEMVQTEDLTGKVFGMLTVLNREADKVGKSGNKYSMWKCRCSCDNKTEILVDGYSLKHKKIISCGCIDRSGKVKTQKDLTGMHFGRWTVLKQGEDYILPSGRRRARWVCQCNCENKTISLVTHSALINGNSLSCGCINHEISRKGITERNYRKYIKNHRFDDDGNITQKFCNNCKTWKNINEFFKSEKNQDGLEGSCNICSRYKTYISGAKSRSLNFNLTIEEFDRLTKQTCNYCGNYSKIDRFKNLPYGVSGIDRIDSSNGYYLENCVPCCNMCNLMKQDFEIQHWLEQVDKIHNYMKKKGNKNG